MKTTNLVLGMLMLALATPVAFSAHTTDHGTYDGPGTVVIGVTDGDTGAELLLADNGAVACTDTDYAAGTAAGRGGICIPFDDLQGDSIQVDDADLGDQVAFQVCVDVSGDGICTANNRTAGPCTDRTVFSHDSANGSYFNPLYVPSHFQDAFDDCDQTGFAGYVVILCAGAHRHFGETAGHTHEVTSGIVTDTTTGGTSTGDFCGGPTAAKAYVVV